MTYIPGVDYFLRWLPFPPDNGTDGGMVMPNDDGTYSVYMDTALLFNKKKARKTWKHEEDHIQNGDLDSGKPIEDVEGI